MNTQAGSTKKHTQVPLVVDLDGTLFKTEIPWEVFVSVLKKHPFQLVKIIFQKIRIRKPAYLKTEMRKWANFSVASLPFSIKFLSWLKEEKAKGRELILCTGSTQSQAEEVQKITGLFTAVYGSTLGTNLIGQKKALFLTGKYGHKQFDYAGNALSDLKVAHYARHFILVNPSFLARVFSKNMRIHRRFWEAELEPSRLAGTLGFPLWFLNCIVFIVPPLFAPVSAGVVFPTLFLAGAHFNFSATAFNILFDLFLMDRDRKKGPDPSDNLFATGDLSIPFGFLLFACFFVLAFVSLIYLGISAVVPSLLYVFCMWLFLHGKVGPWLVPVLLRYVFCALTVFLGGLLIVL